MKSITKKIAAISLILLTLAMVVPYHEFTQVYASSIVREAGKMDAYDYTSSPALAKKLTQVFEGKIGLYTSSKFTKQVYAPLGCSKLTGRNHYYIKGNATGAANNGWQCYIYANAVYNTLYNEWVGRGTSLKNSKVVIKGGSTFSYSQFVKAGVKVGAYVRTTGNKNGSYSGSVAHSFVILGYNENVVTYIEGNADGRGLVRVTKSSWKELNKAQTTGRGRYICHVVQPTDQYYNSLYGGGASASGASASNAKVDTKTTSNTTSTQTKLVDPDTIKTKFKRTLSYAKNKKVLSGGDVLYIQTCLKYIGYSVNTNSKYDSKTAAAVKKFQKANKLTADGKMGKKTWTAIEKAVKTEKSKVTVTFNANGGKNAPGKQKMLPNKATALTKSVPARAGYTFLGWAKSKTASKADYKAGAKITLKKNITLYAVWQEQALKVTSNPADVKTAAGKKVTFTVKATGRELKYQWYYLKAGESEWTLWEKQTAASASLEADADWNDAQVRCEVTDVHGKKAVSGAAKVTVA
jgi:Listeria/Bacterioides repeat